MLLDRQKGFTLVEIAIVLLIVTILLGYTVALFPRQQELKKYKAVDSEMDRVVEAIVGFAQVNGRLPCPATPNTAGVEDGGGGTNCNFYGGFVPVNTLGLAGRLNQDSLLIDPWGNPYRYYVSNSDADADGADDFVRAGEMRDVGLVDVIGGADGFIDLDGNYMICTAAGGGVTDTCAGAAVVFGDPAAVAGGPYAGAPFVLFSPGGNWTQPQPPALADGGATNDELENIGSFYTTAGLAIPVGPSGREYTLKRVVPPVGPLPETTFVRRLTGFADDYDDVVRWVSPSILFSKMIEAGQLP